MDDLTPVELARLADYFAQELTSDEVAVLDRWIAERPERTWLVEDLRRSRLDLEVNTGVDVLNLPERVESIARSFAGFRVADRTPATPSTSPIDRSARPHRSWVHRWMVSHSVGYTVGAMIAGLLLVFAGWRLAEARYGVATPTSVSTYTTGNAERAMVTLPDGSTILLNVGSRLHVASDFASGNRTVHLAGQALFTVTPRAGAPFTVVSGPSVTRVLGTRFSVRHYENDTAATILVGDGKVSVGSTILTSAQAVMVSSNGISTVQSANANALSFAQGVLTINRMSLVDAIPDLNRWYDVEIRLGDSVLNTRRVDGGFKAGSLSDLVSILELMYEVRVVRDGRVLTLYARDCQC